MSFIGLGGRGGGENITKQRITVSSTIREILTFVLMYAIAGLLQIGIVFVTAVLLGQLAGFAFLALAVLLSFEPVGQIGARPFSVGIHLRHKYHARRAPGNVRFAQLFLGVAGVVLTVLALTGYWPALWPWRLTWTPDGYHLLSRILWGPWHAANAVEVVGRILTTLIIPFVGWGSAAILKWAARMEATRPTFRETPHGEINPGTIEGPLGELYEPSLRAGPREEPKRPTVPTY